MLLSHFVAPEEDTGFSNPKAFTHTGYSLVVNDFGEFCISRDLLILEFKSF
jgi:hypothetical protein